MVRPPKKKPAPARRPSSRSAPTSADVQASIVDGSEDAIIGKTLDGVITVWNDGARRLYGWTAAQAVGRSVRILVPPDREAELDRIMDRVRRGEPISHLETVRRRKDGTLLDVSLTISPIRSGGRVVGASTIARDVTARNRADRRFRLVVEATPNALLMADARGRIVLANSQAEKLFGYTREEMLDLTVEDLVPRRYRGAHAAHREGFAAEPRARAMGAGRNLFGVRKDGTEVPVEIGLNPLKEGDQDFVLASVIDISERRAMEKKLAHSEILATIGSMAAVVGHEIRNPLSSIVMAAKALTRGDLPAEDRDQIMSVLLDESQRLQRTLEDFLQYSRPRAPKAEVADLNATVKEVLEAAASDAALVREVQVAARLDPKTPPLRFDADQMRQVLWNVIRNGLQALDGRGRLTVSTAARPAEVEIRIEDDGPGIPADELETVFTPFFTTKTKGTGLGLAISRNIVLSHGGTIRAESGRGKGCAFVVVLPR